MSENIFTPIRTKQRINEIKKHLHATNYILLSQSASGWNKDMSFETN